MLTDEWINELIQKQKIIDKGSLSTPKLNTKRGHNEKDLKITAIDGSEFLIKLRQSQINPSDFSVILIYCDGKTNVLFKLRRYNGNSHQHTNKIECDQIKFNFHIHMATERYQELGGSEEGYAKESAEFNDIYSAFACLKRDCNLYDETSNGQLDIWTQQQNLN